jgi:hypothetical protein
MTLKLLTTAGAVMDILGGNQPAQRLTGDRATTVSNWRNQDHFPAKHYVIINNALAPVGYFAPPWLFGATKARRRNEGKPPPTRKQAKTEHGWQMDQQAQKGHNNWAAPAGRPIASPGSRNCGTS